VTAADTQDPTRFGFVAVLGAPNAGKSTLVNTLVGTKVAIVSRKVQTTRTTIKGIVVAGQSQIVFIDTPGIFRPKRRLDRAMVGAAWTGAQDADAIVLVVDAAKAVDDELLAIIQRLKEANAPLVLVLNKVDRADKEALLGLTARLNAELAFAATFMVSALTGDGVDALKDDLAARVPHGPWHYDADDVTDVPLRLLAAEITREKVYDRLHDELPYAITVETTNWKDMGKKGVRIEQTIFVERESQRAIVLGHKGETIKTLSVTSRAELSEIVEKPVHLFLFVKVREGWANDPERYREMGLDFPKD
jgi:GTP-binding protein Era